MGRGLLRDVRVIVRIACAAATIAGLAGFALLLVNDRLLVLLPALVARVAPETRLELGGARIRGLERLELRRVRLLAASTNEPILVVKRLVLDFSPWALWSGHADDVLLDGPLVMPEPLLEERKTGGGESSAWSIGRLVVRRGRLWMPARGETPGVTFRFALGLRDVGTAAEDAERVQRVAVKDVVARDARGVELLRARGIRLAARLAGLREHGRVDTVAFLSPAVLLRERLPVLAAGTEESSVAWSVGRVVVHDGRFTMLELADRPGVSFRMTGELREIGPGPDLAEQPQYVTARDVVVTVNGTPAATIDAARADFRVAGLLAKRIDQVRLANPMITVPEPVPAFGGHDMGGGAGAGWTFGRLTTHGGHLRVPPSGDLPGLNAGFAFDLREVGTDPARADRRHRVRLADVRVRYAKHPTSLVLDEATLDFTVDGLLERRQLAQLKIDRGTLVLDRTLRDHLTGAGAGAPGMRTTRPWSVAVLDVAELGIRLTDLAPEIPDLTLLVHSRMTDVPLGRGGFVKARTPQRVELANITLDSPLDPFRPVIQIGSVFVDFSLADLLQRRLTAIDVVSPTIYLGEDLIWYMNATRVEAAASPEQPWTVRNVRAELGRIVLTFRGVDRVGLPLRFRTDARNVVLGDLATLRLAAALEVPKQSYTFPGLDLQLLGVEGELRFDYPRGQAQDNVVNTLKVAGIRWRDYHVRDGWLAATFDEKGIDARLGGGAYEGYVNGGATLPFGPGTITGWAACTDLDLEPLAAVVAGQSLEMTGAVDLQGTVDIVQDRIDRAKAELDFKRAGRVSFPALDRLLEKMPATMPPWQRDLARVAIETFRDYPYSSGTGTLTFADFRGEAHLGLQGERGKRRVDVYYYEDAPTVATVAREAE